MQQVSDTLLTYFKTIIECVVILVPILVELSLKLSYYIYFLLNNSKEKIGQLITKEFMNMKILYKNVRLTCVYHQRKTTSKLLLMQCILLVKIVKYFKIQ